MTFYLIERMFESMDWERVTNDEIDETLTHFVALTSASQAQICELVREVDRRQQFLADGSRSLTDGYRPGFSFVMRLLGS